MRPRFGRLPSLRIHISHQKVSGDVCKFTQPLIKNHLVPLLSGLCRLQDPSICPSRILSAPPEIRISTIKEANERLITTTAGKSKAGVEISKVITEGTPPLKRTNSGNHSQKETSLTKVTFITYSMKRLLPLILSAPLLAEPGDTVYQKGFLSKDEAPQIHRTSRRLLARSRSERSPHPRARCNGLGWQWRPLRRRNANLHAGRRRRRRTNSQVSNLPP